AYLLNEAPDAEGTFGAGRSLRDRRREFSKPGLRLRLNGRSPPPGNAAGAGLASVLKSHCEPGAPVVPGGDPLGRQTQRSRARAIQGLCRPSGAAARVVSSPPRPPRVPEGMPARRAAQLAENRLETRNFTSAITSRRCRRSGARR